MLLERIAVIEKPQKQTLYNSYFPNQDQDGINSHNCTHHSHSCYSMPSCTPCCRPQNSCISIQQQLNSIFLKLDNIMASHKLPSSVPSHPVGEPCPNPQPQSFSKPNDDASNSHLGESTGNSISNESIISIDHFMPEAEEEISLNSMAMTSRLHQPMLLE